MKILNRILSILILLAAIAVAVASYLLFQKRDQMLNGWDKLADAMVNTAKELDVNSGTKTAEALTKEKLSHKQTINDLQKNLAVLSAAAKRLVEQRDQLADTLNRVAKIAEVPSTDPAAMKNLSLTDTAQRTVVAGVTKTRDRNDRIIQSYIKVGTSLGISGTTVSDLKKAGAAEAYGERVQDQIERRKKRISIYESGLREIAPQVGSSSPRFAETQYKASVDAVASAARRQGAEYRATKSKVAALEQSLKTARASNDEMVRQIASYKKTIAGLQKDIADLKHKLNPTKNKIIDDYIYDRTPLRSLYAEVRGTVKKVDNEWGIAVINIGRKHDVRRLVANKELSDVILFPKGLTMTVVRGDKTAQYKLIGKIQITDVHDNYSVANINTKSLNGEIVQEGDTVFFTDSDLDEFVPAEKKVASH